MKHNYLAWQQNMGNTWVGFSAYCMRQLGQLRELDINYNITDNADYKVCNDWSSIRWNGTGNFWHEGDALPYDNSWEYYFENQIQSTESDFIESSGEYKDDYVPTPGTKNFRDTTELEIYGKLVNMYFKPKIHVIESLNSTITDKKTLGVHIRRSNMGWYHPDAYLGWSDDEYFNKVMNIFNKHGFEKIYLATEEYSIYNYFNERVPEILLGIDTCYRVGSDQMLEYSLVDKTTRPLHVYNSGLEVLVDTLNLSNCHSMLCFLSGVTSIACFFNNNKFNDVYYFDEI